MARGKTNREARWARLGIGQAFLQKVYTNVSGSAEAERKRENTAYFGTYALAVDTYYEIVIMAHLQFGETIDDPLRVCKIGARAAEAYFYGSWRAEAEGRRSKSEEENWFNAFCEGLLMALVAGDRQIAEHLLEWPSAECPYDSEFADHAKATQASYVELAPVALGVLKAKPCRAAVAALKPSGGQQSRARLIAEAGQALAAHDGPAVGEAVRGLLVEHRRKRARKPGLSAFVDLDASIIYGLADVADVATPGIDVELLDYLVRRDELLNKR